MSNNPSPPDPNSSLGSLLVTHGKPKPAAAGTVDRLNGANKVIIAFLNIYRSQRFYLPGIAQVNPPSVAICAPMTV